MKIRFSRIALILLSLSIPNIFTSCLSSKNSTENIVDKGLTDINGNHYNLIQIGKQIWMTENLKTSMYNDGSEILEITDNEKWANATEGAYCWYDNDYDKYGTNYGALYNWYAVNTGKLCPEGWNVPEHHEWTLLERYICSQINQSDCEFEFPFNETASGERGTSEVNRLAGNKDLWRLDAVKRHPEFGMTGFKAVPGGNRIIFGSFHGITDYGCWWTKCKFDDDEVWYRLMSYNYIDHKSYLSRVKSEKNVGMSVRCVYTIPDEPEWKNRKSSK
jgi:uncharacterized protein (TIGR02145 family)